MQEDREHVDDMFWEFPSVLEADKFFMELADREATIRIYCREHVDDMFWEFPSVSKAAKFVKELAEWELQRNYPVGDIMCTIVECSYTSILDDLGLRVLTVSPST